MGDGSEAFVYSVVRFVPHPVRDEAINVGVVLVSPSGEHVLHKFTRAFRSKLSALAPDVNPGMVERALSDFQARFPRDLAQAPLGSEAEPLTEDALLELSMRYGYQVRFTPPRPIAVKEPERSLAQLFDEYVGTIASLEAGSVPGRAKVRRRVLRRLRDWSFLETGSSNDRGSRSVMVPTHSTSESSVRPMTLQWRSSRSRSRLARQRRSCANAIMLRGSPPTPIGQRGTSSSALCLASRPCRTATSSLSRRASFGMSTSRPSECRRSISSVRYWLRLGSPRQPAFVP